MAAGRLTLDECRTLYRRAYPNCHAADSVLDDIITLAGRHTLAVRLLAETQKAARLSAAALLDKLRESGFHLAGKIRYLEVKVIRRNGKGDILNPSIGRKTLRPVLPVCFPLNIVSMMTLNTNCMTE